jgi:hypothetical protein
MTTARHPVAAHAARTDPGDLIPAPSATGGRRVTLARAAALAANSRRSPKTRDDYAAIYRRFIAWLTDRLGGDPDLEDLTLEVGPRARHPSPGVPLLTVSVHGCGVRGA